MNDQAGVHPMRSSGLRALRIAALCAGSGVLLLVTLAAAAQAGPVDIEKRLTPEQLHATGLDTLSPAQLQLLNRLLREESAQSTNPAAPTTSAAVAAQSQAVAQTAPSPGLAKEEPAVAAAKAAPMFIGLDDQPIKSRIPGSVSGWAPGSEFVLENGQRWKVLKGEVKLPKALLNPSITVIPGVAGRWFLQVDESMPSARVYRIE